jgi:hypothetical protein
MQRAAERQVLARIANVARTMLPSQTLNYRGSVWRTVTAINIRHQRTTVRYPASLARRLGIERPASCGSFSTHNCILRRMRFNYFFAAPRNGRLVFREACRLGCEGIVSKRLGSMYRRGRSPHWVKVKNPNAPAVKREAEEDWGR